MKKIIGFKTVFSKASDHKINSHLHFYDKARKNLYKFSFTTASKLTALGLNLRQVMQVLYG